MPALNNINAITNTNGICFSKQVSEIYTEEEITQLSIAQVNNRVSGTYLAVAFNNNILLYFNEGAAIATEIQISDKNICLISKKEFHEIIKDEGLEIIFQADKLKKSGRGNESIALLTSASKKGCKHSQLILGTDYRIGDNFLKSIKYLKLAARQGSVKANAYLAEIYFSKFIESNDKEFYSKAFKYCTVAVSGKDSNSKYLLGSMYLDIEEPNLENQSKAEVLLSKVANMGHIEAHLGLGHLYYQSVCIKQDLNKSFYHYKIAADAGHPVAQFYAGIAYLEGRGVNKDTRKAISLWFKSANNGFEVAITAVKNNNLLGKNNV